MEKILPVFKPPVTTYMTHAPVLSIISDNDDYLPWFFLNYIQTRVHDDGVDFYHFYTSHYSCPFLDTMYLSRDFIQKYINMNFIDFLINCINDNYYIVAIIDVYFIKLYSSDIKASHPIFIYGYNEENNIFHVADFFRQRNFSFEKSTFNEINAAYKNCDESLNWQKGIHLLKRQNQTKKYSISYFIDTLKRYLYGNEFSVGYNQTANENITFGLNALYEKLLKEIELFKNNKEFDNRVIPIYCDHKNVLRMLNEFFIRNNLSKMVFLKREYEELYKRTLIYRNKFIKYKLMNKNNSFDEEELYVLKNLEIHLLQNTIDILENSDKNIAF